MGERPDQVCQACLSNIHSDDAWMASGWQVFHKRCFRCQQCKQKLQFEDDRQVVVGDPRIVCRTCATGGNAGSITGTYADGDGATDRRAVVDGEAVCHCRKCGRDIGQGAKGAVLRDTTTDGGHRYCEQCFKCTNCRCDPLQHAGGAGGMKRAMFELLDEIFCTECELAYRNRRYLLQKLADGPPLVL